MNQNVKNQRDKIIWEIVQIYKDNGSTINSTYNKLSIITGLAPESIKQIRFKNPVPTDEEKALKI